MWGLINYRTTNKILTINFDLNESFTLQWWWTCLANVSESSQNAIDEKKYYDISRKNFQTYQFFIMSDKNYNLAAKSLRTLE